MATARRDSLPPMMPPRSYDYGTFHMIMCTLCAALQLPTSANFYRLRLDPRLFANQRYSLGDIDSLRHNSSHHHSNQHHHPHGYGSRNGSQHGPAYHYNHHNNRNNHNNNHHHHNNNNHGHNNSRGPHMGIPTAAGPGMNTGMGMGMGMGMGVPPSVSAPLPSANTPPASMHPFYAAAAAQAQAQSRFVRTPEQEQMMQAKRRMAAQRERDLRNYHQEQQLSRSMC